MSWLPIESCPKEHWTTYLCGLCFEGEWFEWRVPGCNIGQPDGESDEWGNAIRGQLTHWHPISPPPAPGAQAVKPWRNPPSIYPEDNVCLEFDLRKLPR